MTLPSLNENYFLGIWPFIDVAQKYESGIERGRTGKRRK
jgi:hypothetical protein